MTAMADETDVVAPEDEAPLPTSTVSTTCDKCGAARKVEVPEPMEPGVTIRWSCHEEYEVTEGGGRGAYIDGCTDGGGYIEGPPLPPTPPLPPMRRAFDSSGYQSGEWEIDPAYHYDVESNRYVLRTGEDA